MFREPKEQWLLNDRQETEKLCKELWFLNCVQETDRTMVCEL